MEVLAQDMIRTLIVEDDAVNRIVAKDFLSKSELPIGEVHCTETLAETLALLEEGPPVDLALLDLNLPDSAGLDTLDAFLKTAPQTAIVVVTGEHGEDLGLEAVSRGAQEYLMKASFNRATLDRAMRYALERKRAKDELKDMQNQVMQNEKLASIGQLAAGVAHEMNTPVGFVASNFVTLRKYMEKFLALFAMYQDLLEIVQSGTKEERLAKTEEICQQRQAMKIDFIMGDLNQLFEESQEGLQRVTSIVQNLRDFSRIDQAGDTAQHNLSEGIRATLVVAQNELKYDADVETDLDELPPVLCHPGQINQVFVNILVNAAHAIRSQERETRGKIVIKTYATDDDVVCEISDDGPGIPDEIISKIFDPFFTTKAPGKGTGLGLNVSYDIIVNKHKGKLQVESEVGKGTTFRISLPRQAPGDRGPAGGDDGSEVVQ